MGRNGTWGLKGKGCVRGDRTRQRRRAQKTQSAQHSKFGPCKYCTCCPRSVLVVANTLVGNTRVLRFEVSGDTEEAWQKPPKRRFLVEPCSIFTRTWYYNTFTRHFEVVGDGAITWRMYASIARETREQSCGCYTTSSLHIKRR